MAFILAPGEAAEEYLASREALLNSEPRVVHCKREPYDVYIGRGSKWGNPFSHLKNTKALFTVETREQAITMYEGHLYAHPELIEALPELRGKTLGCWCAPKACHGDMLLRLANA